MYVQEVKDFVLSINLAKEGGKEGEYCAKRRFNGYFLFRSGDLRAILRYVFRSDLFRFNNNQLECLFECVAHFLKLSDLSAAREQVKKFCVLLSIKKVVNCGFLFIDSCYFLK